MTSPTNTTQYCTVRSWYMRKRIDHWCSVVPEKIPTLGPTVQWETRQASFPTGTVGPRVGIFLSPLNTNDGFYLSRISYAYLTWVAMWDRCFQQRAYIGITRSWMRWYVRKKYLTWVKTTEILIWCVRIYFTDRSKAVLLLWIFYCFSILCLLYLCMRLFIYALWSPAGKRLTSWLLFVVSNCSLLSPWYPGSGVVLDCIDS